MPPMIEFLSILSLTPGYRFCPRICSISFSISAGLVFGISSHLAILDQSPSHSGAPITWANHYLGPPLMGSFFPAGVRLFRKGTPPHQRWR